MSRNPKSNCCPLPHFWSTVRRKRLRFVHIQPVIPTRRMIRGILGWSDSELLSSSQIIKIKFKNQKHIEVDVLFKAYPMIPLSGWSNLSGRYLQRYCPGCMCRNRNLFRQTVLQKCGRGQNWFLDYGSWVEHMKKTNNPQFKPKLSITLADFLTNKRVTKK